MRATGTKHIRPPHRNGYPSGVTHRGRGCRTCIPTTPPTGKTTKRQSVAGRLSQRRPEMICFNPLRASRTRAPGSSLRGCWRFAEGSLVAGRMLSTAPMQRGESTQDGRRSAGLVPSETQARSQGLIQQIRSDAANFSFVADNVCPKYEQRNHKRCANCYSPPK